MREMSFLEDYEIVDAALRDRLAVLKADIDSMVSGGGGEEEPVEPVWIVNPAGTTWDDMYLQSDGTPITTWTVYSRNDQSSFNLMANNDATSAQTYKWRLSYSYNRYGGIVLKGLIDCSGYTTLRVKYVTYDAGYSNYTGQVLLVKDINNYYTDDLVLETYRKIDISRPGYTITDSNWAKNEYSEEWQWIDIDVSDIDEFYLGFRAWGHLYIGAVQLNNGESIDEGDAPEHIELSYLTTDFGGYINTGIYPNPNYTVEMYYALDSVGSTPYIFGCKGVNAVVDLEGGGSNSGCLGTYMAGYAYSNGGTLQVTLSNSYDTIPPYYTYINVTYQDTGYSQRGSIGYYRIAKLQKNVFTYGDSTLTFASSDSIDPFPQPLYLFGCNNNGILLDGSTGKIRCVYVKIWDHNDNLVMDLIPVIKTDNTVCMYDKVTEEYFYNAGTGSFTATYK